VNPNENNIWEYLGEIKKNDREIQIQTKIYFWKNNLYKMKNIIVRQRNLISRKKIKIFSLEDWYFEEKISGRYFSFQIIIIIINIFKFF